MIGRLLIVVLAAGLAGTPALARAADVATLDVQKELDRDRVALVVLYFHASWCGPCKAQRDQFEDIRLTYGRKLGIRFLSISSKDDKCERPTWSVAENYCDRAGNVAERWGVSAYPSFVAFGWTGTEAFRVISGDGSPRPAYLRLREALDAFVARNPTVVLSIQDGDLERQVMESLEKYGKIAVAGSAKHEAEIAVIRAKNPDALACEPGQQLEPNTLLVVDRAIGGLWVEAMDLGRGESRYTAWTPGGAKEAMAAFVRFHKWGFEDPGRAHARVVPPPANARLSSEPAGAAVRLDGVEVCPEGTPVCRVSTTPGKHKVQMRLGGLQPKVAEVEFACGMAPLAWTLNPETAVRGYVRIPAGEFDRGSPSGEAGRYDDEARHHVRITRPFLLKVTEVTQAEWRALMGNNPSYFKACGGDCPVEQVRWDDAVAYVNKLSESERLPKCYGADGAFTGLACRGYRLPTEAEWEYAARAKTTGPYYGKLDSIAWHGGNSGGTTHPVGRKGTNAFGLFDMLGNVWEWTNDWKGAYAREATDPTGPSSGWDRVNRGGGWVSNARSLRAAHRGANGPRFRYDALGFRPARSLFP